VKEKWEFVEAYEWGEWSFWLLLACSRSAQS
jgi:hypothetical protein